jgi:putative ABC transport system substrate-binding protein
MQRRTFLRGSGATLAAFGISAAEPAKSLPLIGFLGLASAASFAAPLAAFREGLRAQGFVERKNVTVAYRWAGGDPAKLPALAAELVRRGRRSLPPARSRSLRPMRRGRRQASPGPAAI